jgi:von Willebrand factor type A domain
MLTFRTAPPQSYLPPTREEMREAATKVGLKTFSHDLVADLCNLAAGGQVLPPSAYRRQVREQAERTLPAPDANGRWHLKAGGTTQSREAAIEDRAAQSMRYHRNVCDFLGSADVARFPGATPLDQAVALLKLLSKQPKGSGGGEAGERLPIFTENDSSEKVAEQLGDVLDTVDSLSEDEQDMLDPEGKAHEVQPEDGERTGEKRLDRLKVAEDLVEGSDKRAMLEVSRVLDTFTKLQLRRQKKVEVDPEGDEVRRRPMRDLSEIGRLSPLDISLRKRNRALFLLKAVTQQFSVRERVTRIEKKQAVFILIDGSGSMRSGKRHWKATGVVMNRLKAVLSGDAEVWASVFDTNLGRVRHAATPAEARELIAEFAKGNFTGGGTDIAAAVKAAHAFIEEKMKAGEALYRPEIVVLTDDDTSAGGVRPAEIPGTRVHGFAMETRNPALVKLAQSTGGVGLDNF